MRLIKVTGGLGNQMFIYAFYMQMKKHFSDTRLDLSDMVHYRVHHGYEMHRVFNLPKTEVCINQLLKKTLEFLFFKTILERKQNGSMVAYNKKYGWPFVYFKGFYQSERYFSEISDEIRSTFTFNLNIANTQSLAMMEKIDADENAISLHIRRGDYLAPEHYNSIGCICQLPYYQNAICTMNKKLAQPSYYVFSDDIAWVKANIKLPQATYIDWNKGKDSWQDMMLMSHCRHHIICNSTFSWWGAWLNPRKDKMVFCPEKWFSHSETPYIYPKTWIKIPIK